MNKHIADKLKDKKGYALSTEHVIVFVFSIMVAFILLQVTLCSFTIYSMNVTANNVARAVSVQGGFTYDEAEDIYTVAEKGLQSKIKPDTMVIHVQDINGNNLTTLTSKSKNKDLSLNYGDKFVVVVRAKVPFVKLGNQGAFIDFKSTASGVSEVYNKTGGLNG